MYKYLFFPYIFIHLQPRVIIYSDTHRFQDQFPSYSSQFLEHDSLVLVGVMLGHEKANNLLAKRFSYARRVVRPPTVFLSPKNLTEPCVNKIRGKEINTFPHCHISWACTCPQNLSVVDNGNLDKTELWINTPPPSSPLVVLIIFSCCLSDWARR